ncbi:TadE/TadG family type IV pilus assembly protein, partial [Ruania albidiflava]
MSSGPESPRAESGSALVDFLLVAVLVTVLVLGVVQLALVLHVRTVLIDSAAEGARYA